MNGHQSAAPAWSTATGPAGDVREALGRLVRETWVKWAAEQPDPKSNWLTGWDELDAGQREVDMRIGEAVAAAERERLGVIPLSETLTDEEVAGIRERLESVMANPGPLRVLPSDRWRERAEAAEAKLAEVRERAGCWSSLEAGPFASAGKAILDIIGGEEAAP